MLLSKFQVFRRDEKLLFIRERAAGVYGTPAYFLSVLIFDLIPLRVLPPILFTLFSYWMIGLHPHCSQCILGFTLVVIQTNVVATLMSMMIGAASSSSAVANTIGSMVRLVVMDPLKMRKESQVATSRINLSLLRQLNLLFLV